MTEDINTETFGELPVEDELTALKERAALMGITHHPSIGIDKLRDKINAFVNGEEAPADDDEPDAPEATEEAPVVEETIPQRNKRLKNESTELIRVNITCMNPNKSEWEGEVFTCGNAVVGTVKKYVPFGEDYHVPRIILTMIEDKFYQSFFTQKGADGQKTRKGKMSKEFAIRLLDPLTEEELQALAQRQAMAAGTSE